MFYGRDGIKLDNLIFEAFDKYLTSEEYTRYLLMSNIKASDLDEFDLDLELNNPTVHKVTLHCIKKSNSKCLYTCLSYKDYYLDIIELEVDAFFIYHGFDTRFDDCNVSNHRHYKVIVTTDKHKDYKRKLDIGDSRLTYEFKIDIRNYDWSDRRRYSDRQALLDRYNTMKSYNILDLVNLELLNMPAEEIGWVYENNNKDINIYCDSEPFEFYHRYDEKEYVFDMNGFLYNYYLACKDRKRAKNKINLYIKLNKHMVMDIKYLETLSLLNIIFDKIEIVESLRW